MKYLLLSGALLLAVPAVAAVPVQTPREIEYSWSYDYLEIDSGWMELFIEPGYRLKSVELSYRLVVLEPNLLSRLAISFRNPFTDYDHGFQLAPGENRAGEYVGGFSAALREQGLLTGDLGLFQIGFFGGFPYDTAFAYDIEIKALARNIGVPIPEPAAWAMMVLGFGLVGSAVRRRAALPA